MVTSIRCIGTPFSFAYTSISVTPQDEMAPRKASLLVRASGCGCVDESSTRRWPRAWLTARPMVPLLDDRIVSILTLLMGLLREGETARRSGSPGPALRLGIGNAGAEL